MRRLGSRKPSGASSTDGDTREADELKQRREALRRQNEELGRRREELAGQVAKEHWDLGGLAYEMAVRDHFRLDVLVRRAAVLQEHDMQLAELDRKLGAVGAEGTPAAAPAGGQQPPADRKGASRKGSALWVWGLLLPTFLGFGVLLGTVTAGSGSAAAGGSQVRLTPGASAGAANPSASPAASSSSPESTSSPASEASPETTYVTSGPGTRAAASSPVAGTSGTSEGGASEAGSPGSSEPGTGSGGAKTLPPIKHVFVVMLSDQPYASVFGPESKASYLTHTLASKGELLVRYYAVAHEELANEIALISGQGPTPQTAANCPSYSAIAPATLGGIGQVLGQGCVYPHSTTTLGDQLAAKHLAWRAYIEGMGAGSSGASAGCQHPALGANDPSAAPGAATPYATFRNPFLYFDSITGSSACASDDASLTRLQGDLGSENRTPAFTYIAPDRCHDASPTPCAPGQPAGPADTDGFLKTVVGEIMASKAYRNDGLLVITTDEAPATGEYADSSSCCGQPKFPNLPTSTGIGGLARGGGQVGALLLSPYIKGATTEANPYNTFSLLRTVEDLFHVPHLGYAGLAEVSSLPPSLFMASKGGG